MPIIVKDKEHAYYNPGLFKCMHTVPPVTGCEAAYLFPTAMDLCLSDTTTEGHALVENEEGVAGNLVMHIRSGDIFVDPVHHGYGQVKGGSMCFYVVAFFLMPICSLLVHQLFRPTYIFMGFTGTSCLVLALSTETVEIYLSPPPF